ncbi:MAG: 4-alpha-glucanotransferase [Chthoniobacterales bacterium]
MNLSPDQRIAGVLTPLFALRGEDDLGIGDLGTLRAFIDWAAGVGFKLVQLLPINETGGDNSPYNAISAMAIEPSTLHLAPGSPNDLSAEDFEEVIAQADLTKLRRGAVKYPQVRALKRALLEKAFLRFEARRLVGEDAMASFQAFLENERAWLEDYVFFRALMDENDGREAWDHWPLEHQKIATARHWFALETPETQARFRQRQSFFRYVQWVAYAQWSAVKAYADSRGVALMGDIPFGVSYYSADVFSRPNEFKLDWSGGAPPEPYFKDDEFTQKWGQNWGIPLYDWAAMRTNDFAWWRQRIAGVRRIFHLFRIDHVLGFYRIYAFPWRPQSNEGFLPLNWEEMLGETGGRWPQFTPRADEPTEDAEANRREGEEYLEMALAAAGETRLVGEDLGTVPDYVRPSLHSLGITGFKIPQWETRPDGSVVGGDEYERLSVATYATHDHKPLRAMWEEAVEKPGETSAQARGDLEKIASFAGIGGLSAVPNYEEEFYAPALAALFRSNAWLAIVMITDLLLRKDRFNVPGTAADSNWSRRLQLTVARLRSSPSTKRRMKLIRRLIEESGRG